MHAPSSLIRVGRAALRCLVVLVVCTLVEHVKAAPEPASPAFSAKDLISRVLGDTEDVWNALFAARGHPAYPQPLVMLFSRIAQSACGPVGADVEPYYCATDRRIYVDPAVFGRSSRVDPLGDSAKAFLIARAVGFHVQNLLGTPKRVDMAHPAMNEAQRSQLSVRFEMQADCYAGVWAHFAQKRSVLDARDVDQITAAIGVSDPSTHGPAAERIPWFRKGLSSGDPQQCDTLAKATPN